MLDVVLPSLALQQPGLKDAINSRLMGSSLASSTFSRYAGEGCWFRMVPGSGGWGVGVGGGLGSLFLAETYKWAVVITEFSSLPSEELALG